MAQASFYFVLGCFLVFLAYLLFNLPMRLVVSLFYTCRIPKSFPEDAEQYHWQKTKSAAAKAAFQNVMAPEPAAAPQEAPSEPEQKEE